MHKLLQSSPSIKGEHKQSLDIKNMLKNFDRGMNGLNVVLVFLVISEFEINLQMKMMGFNLDYIEFRINVEKIDTINFTKL
ncbi:hypothetical protein H671_1g2560 [Cricetulus griseus]|uniref:Uncharacterized protein n=1 Tax=Cricetulus griseus TaxID=10029 RepID=A0A061IMJ7_CRIGR|nr:hypothetical protein H671_1g2560 [Cricetulus griseus]